MQGIYLIAAEEFFQYHIPDVMRNQELEKVLEVNTKLELN